METIIGLGSAGCKIAKCFDSYSNYDIYCLDTERQKGFKTKKITERKSHEEYEQKCPPLKTFFKDAKPPYLFILAGSGMITGMALRVMQQLKSTDISVLYIKPDTDLLSEKAQKRERVVFHVLQQYARSALLENMFVFSNVMLEKILQDLPIIGYYDKINEMMCTTIHMLNVFNNTDAIMSTSLETPSTARISTLGLVDAASGEENFFYELKNPRDKKYYFSIQKEQLEKDGALFREIITQIKERSLKDVKISYSIYSNNYEHNYGYVLANASLIQEEIIK